MHLACSLCNRRTLVVLPSGVVVCTTCDLTPQSSIPNLEKPRQ